MSHDVTKGVTVVLVDDDQDHLALMGTALRTVTASSLGPITVNEYLDAAEALADLPPRGSVVVMCDHRMPGATGLEWLQDFVRARVGPVILITSHSDDDLAVEAFRRGASDFVKKSDIFAKPESVVSVIREALRRFEVDRCNRELRQRLKAMNMELERKNAALAALSETAHRFVDNVAHEFRTPLAVIKEFASIIDDGLGGPVSERQHEYLNFIASATSDLAGLVDDFLDSGKLRTKTLRVDRRSIEVSALLDGIMPLVTARAATRDITCEVTVDPDVGPAFADGEKAGRVLVNLAVNAIKFSERGSIVDIRARPANGGVEMAVVDQGPGLPPEEVDLIFDRFRQAGSSHHATEKGFGLGLSIASELAWLNLGTLTVTSTLGEGSTFAFWLPTDDPERIAGCYFDRLAEQGERGQVSALHVHDAEHCLRIRAFLVHNCHPMDLVLPAPEGWFLFGVTIEPERWEQRFIRAAGAWPAGGAAGLVLPAIEHLGTWEQAEAREHVKDLVRPHATADR